MSPREDFRAKGARYVTEGRLVVREVDEYAGAAIAECRGQGAVWTVGFDEHGWFCDCPARGRCAHIHALALVVAMEPRE